MRADIRDGGCKMKRLNHVTQIWFVVYEADYTTHVLFESDIGAAAVQK